MPGSKHDPGRTLGERLGHALAQFIFQRTLDAGIDRKGCGSVDLLFLEKQVHEGVAMSDLNNAVLEMRLQEKNLFLYDDPGARIEADSQAAKALQTLESERRALREVSAGPELAILRSTIFEARPT